MAERHVDHLLVGGGVASAHCAAELRRRGAQGQIMLVGREPEPPYDRPPLSKQYLRGDSSREDAHVHESSWYEDNDVELLTGKSVMSLDAERRTAKLQGGEEVGFDKALLATGAMVNLLRLEGARLHGIHYLRAFGNAEAIRDDIESAEHVALIGGSYIGAEVAASLIERGKRCTIVMMEDVLLSGGFGAEVGRRFHELLESKGVEIVAGETVASFEGEERVERLRTEAGREIDCDAVVVGSGVKPDTMLAGRAGLEVGDGIVCDSGLETSVAGIYAAGDCCSYESELHGRRVRIEHWDVALQQGRHAARAMLGDKQPYRVVPYFFSDLSDWAAIEYVGLGGGWEQVVWRGPSDGNSDGDGFSAWYLAGDRLIGAVSVGRSEDLAEARRLIDEGAVVEGLAGLLANPESDLGGIA